jgi:predicted methyltransferase
MPARIFLSLSIAVLLSVAAFASGVAAQSSTDLPKLRADVDNPQRDAKNSARDKYRHPFEVLSFFDVADNATVVEIDPGGAGYWTEILAPYLKDRGRYIAGNPPGVTAEAKTGAAAFAAKLAADPKNYSKVEVAEFDPGAKDLPAATGAADIVLTFRNIHNWMAEGKAEAAFRAFYAVLKPGGVLGVEEHRGRTDQPQDPLAKSGYVREDYAIGLAEAAGFKLAGASEVNANPKDTKDYPVGVWALPPTFRLKDQDHDKYAAIGESDRFVLKFVKPQ